MALEVQLYYYNYLLKDYLDFEKVKYSFIQRRKSDQDYFVADITYVKSIINWEPKVSFDVGIDQMIDWTKKMMK